jgi:hypothetical protein
VGQVLGVADLEGYLHSLDLSTPLGLFDQVRHVVQACGLAGAPCGGDGRVSGPGRHVEHPGPRPHVDRLTQEPANDHDLVADPREVSR